LDGTQLEFEDGARGSLKTEMKHVHGTRRDFLAVTGAAGLAALGARRGLSALADSVSEKDVLANKPVAYPNFPR